MTTWADRIGFRVSTADPDDDPVWVDVSDYLLTTVAEIGVEIGRQNDLDQSNPTVVDLLLNNTDGRFTYGNTSSPYAAWWGPGRKCQLFETIGTTIVEIFTGYLQTPTETIMSPLFGTVHISAVDRLSRLATAEPFVSTLAEHIKYAGRSGTQFWYYPLSDAGAPFAEASATSAEPMRFSAFRSPGGSIAAQAGTAIVADDVRPHRLTMDSAPSGIAFYLAATLSTKVNLAGTDVLTVTVWGRREVDYSTTVLSYLLYLWDGGNDFLILRTGSAGTAGFKLDCRFGAGTATSSTFSDSATERWALYGAQIALSPASASAWMDDQTASPSFSGSPSDSDFQYIISGLNFDGSTAHAMVHIGPAGSYTHEDFLAQREMGLHGLERQTTGERIRTIAAYAGIPLAEYDSTVDDGTVVMQRASLAGKTPLEAMREAERAEQGLLYVDGAGQLVFKDKRSIYNI